MGVSESHTVSCGQGPSSRKAGPTTDVATATFFLINDYKAHWIWNTLVFTAAELHPMFERAIPSSHPTAVGTGVGTSDCTTQTSGPARPSQNRYSDSNVYRPTEWETCHLSQNFPDVHLHSPVRPLKHSQLLLRCWTSLENQNLVSNLYNDERPIGFDKTIPVHERRIRWHL